MIWYEYHDVKMKPREQIGTHLQSSWELDLVLTGSGERCICGNRAMFSRGDLVLIPPEVEHRWDFCTEDTDDDGEIHNITFIFTDSFVERLGETLPAIRSALISFFSQKKISVFHGKNRKMIESLLVRMADMPPERRAVLIPELLMTLCRCEDVETFGVRQRQSETDKRAERLMIYCVCNYMKNISISSAARHIGVNKSTVCRIVKERFGVTFTSYVNGLRLRQASYLLEATDSAISTIVYECGFNNISYFNKLFKEEYGVTPLQFRRH